MPDTREEHSSSSKPRPECPEMLLARFQPLPSSHFYQRMSNAPWMKDKSTRSLWSLRPRLALGFLALLVILLLVSLLAFQPIQAIARQVMFYFIVEPKDELTIQVTLSPTHDLNNYMSVENFPLTLSQAQAQAGFTLKQLTNLSSGPQLIGANYDPEIQAVTQLYEGKGYNLLLIQRPLADGDEFFSIGASAQVEIVQIGDTEAEYVAGGWKANLDEQSTSASGTQVNLGASWDSSLPQYTLRWKSGAFAFELRSSGSQAPQKSDLIALAEGLK
jgi:hypothetical protein